MHYERVGTLLGMADNSTARPPTPRVSAISWQMSLPLLGIGLATLLLSFCFCTYLWWLKRQGHQERGYNHLSFSPNSKKMKNDTCPVCLEDFKRSEKLAVSPCQHCFHTKCLTQWLEQHDTCPMCKTQITHHAGERTGLIASQV